jgi:hypothetical protein
LKVVKATAREWGTDRIEFGGWRSATIWYKVCKNLGYVEILPRPGNEQLFALTEDGFNRSLEVIDSIYRGKFGESSTTEKTIDKNVVTDEFLSYDEYIKRRDVQILIQKYPSFIGRQDEMNRLSKFLNDPSNPLLLLSGNGGTGKTRLILEFVKHLQEKENRFGVSFLNPYKETISMGIPNNTLIILDDAQKQFINLNKIIDSLLNSVVGSKLILIERPIFIKSIMNMINEKNVNPEVLSLARGQIEDFLMNNFAWIDEGTAKHIAKDCRDSFDYSAACAEYYIAGGKIAGLTDVLSWKTGKYIKDIAERIKGNILDVEYIIQLFSMLTPLDWDHEKGLFVNEFPDLYGTIENIVYGAKNRYEDSIIVLDSDSILSIKPDPLADFLRTKALQDPKLQGVLWRLVPYMPARITQNILSIGTIEQLGPERIMEFIYEIWNLLNSEIGRTREFGTAIVLFTGTATEFLPTLYSRKPNIKNWLAWSHRFHKRQSKRFSFEVELALYNVCINYLQQGNFVEFNDALTYWDLMYKECRIKDYEIAPAYVIGKILDYGKFPPLKQLEQYKARLELLYTKYPSELNLSYAKILLRIYQYHAEYDSVLRPKILYKYIKQLKHMYEKHPTDDVAKILIGALLLSIAKDRTADLVMRDVKYFRQLFERHKDSETKSYAKFALLTVKHLWKESDLVDMKQDLEYMQTSTAEIDEKKYSYNYQEFVGNEDFEKALDEECASLVDYEIHSTEYGMFVIVLDDNILPAIQANDEDMPVHDTLLNTHVFIDFTHKAIDSDEKNITLLICPVRARKDHQLRAMLKNIVFQKTDSITKLFTNEALIGLTNKKGISILKNSVLTIAQKKRLMEKEKCVGIYITSQFRTIPLLYEIINSPEPDEKLKKLRQCPYCFNSNYV